MVCSFVCRDLNQFTHSLHSLNKVYTWVNNLKKVYTQFTPVVIRLESSLLYLFLDLKKVYSIHDRT
jgi:hypothetical protein